MKICSIRKGCCFLFKKKLVTFTFVKIKTIILSIYLILLSCLPCADTKVNEFHIDSISTSIANNSHSHTNEKHTDLCPPFCSCNCCAAQVLSFNPAVVFIFIKENQLILSPVPTYSSTFQSNFFGSIWQPPQIV
ncbi:DUF6660 family protein [Flavobacterium sp. TMP13]|uniref:DUF6660 family protein n=1 Tax=Flavobacterium sp. TMP13 TaxID=3425950 RepID=UPI00076DD9F7|nr:hypothetical protein AP058_00696 [Flavobacterium sp. TAB 87]